MEHSNSQVEPVLHVNDIPIYFEEEWDIGIGGGLWSTGKAMAIYMIEHQSLIRKNVQNLQKYQDVCTCTCQKKTSEDDDMEGGKYNGIKTLELGSGNGLLSICLAAVAQDLIGKLVVTDLEDHLELMEKTVRANPHIVNLDADDDDNNHEENQGEEKGSSKSSNNSMNSRRRPRTLVKEHRWGEFETEEKDDEKFDFIIGSDVAYRDYLHEPLVRTLVHYSHPGTIALVGVTMIDTKPKFFHLLKENGFSYQRIPDEQMAPEFRGTTFGLFVIQRVHVE